MGRKPAKGRDDGSKKWCRQLCMTDAELTTLRALMRERIQQSTVQEIPQHGNHRENKFWCNGTLFPALQNEFPKHFPNPIISDKEKLRVIQEIMVREKVLLKSEATNRANNQTQEGSSAANEAFGTAEVFETIRYGDHQVKERTVNNGLVEDEQNTLVDYTGDSTTIDGTESSLKVDTLKSGDKKLCIIETRRIGTTDCGCFAEPLRFCLVTSSTKPMPMTHQTYGFPTKNGSGLWKGTGILTSQT